MTTPQISVVIPCYNEEDTIERVMDALYKQTLSKEQFEVIIADGGSSDRTLQLISDYQTCHPDLNLRVIDNPQRIIPAGLNLAIKAAQGKIITRMDAHTLPAHDYLELCAKTLEEGRGQNVGGVLKIEPSRNTWIGRSIAAAAAHPLGVGDALYRWATEAGPADTVAFGTFYRSLFDQIGFFDESLLINEDYELNVRIRMAGGTIWIDPAIQAVYFSRANLAALIKQYFSYGFWKVKMLRRYPKTLRWRQALPPLFVFGILMLLLGSAFLALARILLVCGLAAYILILAAGSIPAAIKRKEGALVIGIPAAIAAMHFSWGAGFLWSLFNTRTRKS